MTATSTTSRWELKILFLIADSLFQLFDGETDIEGQIITFCGSIAESRQTTTNTLYVRWVQPSQNQYSTQNFPEVFFNTIYFVHFSNILFLRYFAEAKGIGSEFAAWFSVLTQQVTKPNPTKLNQTKPNQAKQNQTKPNQTGLRPNKS